MSDSKPSTHSRAGLLARAREGDEEAFGALFESCAPRVLAYIRLRLSPELAGRLEPVDVLQETALEAFRSIHDFETRESGSLSGWLCRIAENRLRDLAGFHGAQKRRAPRADRPLSRLLERACRSATGPLSAAAREEGRERVAGALERLEPAERDALLLRYFQGAGTGEIATQLGRSETAVRRLLGRAAVRVGQLLEGGER